MEVKNVVLHQTLGKQHSILVVITLPGHERDEQVFAQAKLAVGRGRSVGEDLSGFTTLAFVNERQLVDAGGLVGPRELNQMEFGFRTVVFC